MTAAERERKARLMSDAEALVRSIYDGKQELDDATVRSVAEKIVRALPRGVR
jgi:hypothetical protein